MEVALQILRSL